MQRETAKNLVMLTALSGIALAGAADRIGTFENFNNRETKLKLTEKEIKLDSKPEKIQKINSSQIKKYSFENSSVTKITEVSQTSGRIVVEIEEVNRSNLKQEGAIKFNISESSQKIN